MIRVNGDVRAFYRIAVAFPLQVIGALTIILHALDVLR